MDFPNFPSISPASTTVLGVLLLILYNLLRKSITAFNDSPRSPPEASGVWPIIGHLPLLGGSRPAHITLGEMADKHGPIFTIRIGVHRALVVSSWEIVKECFTTNDKAFCNRPKAVALEHMAYNYAMFGFSPYGPYWRQLRKIATLELLSNHRIQSLVGVRESEVKRAVKGIHERWVKDNRALVDMKKWFGEITLNVAMRTVVGKRFGRESGGGGGGDDDRCRKSIREFFRLLGTFVVGDAIPWLRCFDFGGHEKVIKKTAKELDQILEELLDEHKEKKKLVCEGQLGDEDIKQDFMGVLLSILDDAEEVSRYDADTIIKSTCLVCTHNFLK